MFRLLNLLCITTALALISEINSCETVDSEIGHCTKLTDCSSLFDVMKVMPEPLTSSVTDYLKRSWCGCEGKIPKVCCPFLVNGRSEYNDLSTHKNAHLLTEKICGKSSTARIHGGTEVRINEFPWMALLVYDTGYHCGGSVINERYVLTAAHCITDHLLRVRIGEHTISNVSDCDYYMDKLYCAPPYQEIGIKKVIKHEMYQGQQFINDIALIRVVRRIDFTVANAMPICLPIYGNLQNDDIVGKTMTVAGWGLTEKGKMSDVLLRVGVEVISDQECEALYKEKDILSHSTAKKICAGTVGRDSCNGDSGGPLVYLGMYNNSLNYVQQGIVSYGYKKCGTNVPGVYVKVLHYVKWILDHIKP